MKKKEMKEKHTTNNYNSLRSLANQFSSKPAQFVVVSFFSRFKSIYTGTNDDLIYGMDHK